MSELADYGLYLGVLGLIIAGLIHGYNMKRPEGSKSMHEFEDLIREGAMVYLKTEYLILIVPIFAVFLILGSFLDEWNTSSAFLTGAACSMAAGFVCIAAGTRYSSRTSEATDRSGLSKALDLSYLSGSVMGLTIVGLGLLGLGFWFRYYGNDPADVKYITGYALGAGLSALFARIGGGIFHNAADVAQDLIGQVEAGIANIDPRNPGVFAKNIGHYIGGLAGMGSDIFESIICSIIACIAIGATLPINSPGALDSFITEYPILEGLSVTAIKIKFIALPILVAMAGLVSSIISLCSIKLYQNGNQAAISRYTMFLASCILIITSVALIIYLSMPWTAFWSIFSGIICGIFIVLITEYYTSGNLILRMTKKNKKGVTTIIIAGLAIGMKSTFLPVLGICATCFIGYHFSGVYGIGLSAVGMLGMAGAVITANSYSPIIVNASAITEMAELGSKARKTINSLDIPGKTASAIYKGYSTGAAAITTLALFIAFAHMSELDKIDIKNPLVIIGAFIGAVIPMICASLIVTSVGNTACKIFKEIRRQFREISGLLEGREGIRPDIKRCISIATLSSFREMIAPGLIVILAPVFVGFLLGKETLGGMLFGSAIMGVFLSLVMTNGGSAWENAKKIIDKDLTQGRGSEMHEAAQVGRMIGNRFKDASGPAMNISIKLITVVALILAPRLPDIGLLGRF